MTPAPAAAARNTNTAAEGRNKAKCLAEKRKY